MSLKENLFPPWSRNFVSQLSVKVYTDAHQHNGCAPFTWKQKSLEFLVILLLNKTFCLWGFLYFRSAYFYKVVDLFLDLFFVVGLVRMLQAIESISVVILRAERCSQRGGL